MAFRRILFFVLSFCILQGCAGDPYAVDTSEVDYRPEFLRLDRAIFDLPKATRPEDLTALRNTFDGFLDLYFEDIMRVGPVDNPMTSELFSRFLSDPVWQDLQKTIEQRHPDLDDESRRIGEAMRRYAVLFEADTLPRLVAYNSGFNVGVYPTSEWLGVGLEWYSGGDYPIIDRLPPDLFPQYKRDKMKPEFLVPNAVKGWLMVRFADQLTDTDLLGHMVFFGKILYITKALVPDLSIADLLNYTNDQLAWSRSNEFDVWKHFVENDLIFTKDGGKINQMTGDGPFTPGMPPQSPGGIGTWVGYRMVESYMKRHSDTTLKELMAMENDRAFLQTYKPGK